MFLKSLQIQGFKSFPDRVTVNFVKGITAIVGPNGSGKSNISDAVRWVLGESAPRVLRIKLTEDLIFGGTTERRAQGFAEVALSFDNADRALAVDSDEVTVVRRYYRSGKSEQKINGMNVRLQDITELLMDTGLGKNGYSIIGQGKVSAIIDARSDERRVIFEEAAGISKFRYRKGEAERNLKKAEENLVHLEVILSGLEERVGPLEKESEKARKYLELMEERKKSDIGLWLSKLEQSNSVLRDYDYKLTLMHSQLEDADKEIEDNEALIEQLFAKNNELAARKDEISREAAQMDSKAGEIERDAAVLSNDLEHNGQTRERLEGELRDCEKNDSALLEEIEAKRVLSLEKKRQISELEEQSRSSREELSALSEQLGDSGRQLDQTSAEQNDIALRLSEARVRYTASSTQAEEVRERADKSEEALRLAGERKGRLEEEQKLTREAISAAEEKVTSLSNSAGGYKLRLDKQRAKVEESKRRAEQLELEAREGEHKARMIEDLEKNLDGFAYSVKKVMEYFSQGQLRGIHGPVSRLIEVDREYAAAVEIALGAGMQNIVVDNEEDAKRAIEKLKRSGGGRATFLPLTTIKPNHIREQGLSSCEGYVGIAAELVRCDEKYRSIVDNLLGKICVAEDMDAAIAIARRFSYRFRIVTLDGQVINAGGSMTGGSLGKNTGVLARRGEIESLKAQAAKTREQALNERETLKELTRKASADEAALLGVQGELATTQEDIVSFRADLKILTDQLEQCSREISAIELERGGAQRRIEQLLSEAKQKESEILTLEADAERLRSLISERTGERDRLAEIREGLIQALSDNGMKKLSLSKELEALRDSAAELESRRGSQEQKKQETLSMLKEAAAESARLAQEISRLDELANKLRENAEQTRSSGSQLQTERNELDMQMQKKRAVSRELSERRDGLSRETVRAEEQKKNVQLEYDSMISRLLEDYNLTRREAEQQYEPAEDIKRAERRSAELKSQMKRLEPVNLGAIEEYKEVYEKYTFHKTQLEDIESSKNELEKLIGSLTEQMKHAFLSKFEEINGYFREIFTELFGGGHAELSLTDTEDTLSSGIDIAAAPPGKVVKNIDALSGGEKTIIAVAIYFAIMKVNPSPFCFLDEIDSALDENNVVNIARYVQKVSERTQYIIITHRRGTMEVAGTLYGVTMQKDGESKLLELNVSEIEEKLGIN